MIERIQQILRDSAEVKRKAADDIATDIAAAADLIVGAYEAGRKTLIFGNGGSAADAQHFAAELVGRFQKERAPLPSISLNTNTSTITSIANDYDYDHVFIRQLEAFTRAGDVVIGISTSGISPNVLAALEKARALGAKTIGLTGRKGGSMPAMCDVCVVVPSESTARIQETHITILHIWCEIIESRLFGVR
ncbi:MAG: D-sedoheptulose 7-phosphate isomerase [Candidatus Sumerlaeaceae bacterium]|nr:D-sedoheptulose 7-phosphate isomerase [Candidatus Sumerlaeaceae bacterium]